jgi:hypothetical protein
MRMFARTRETRSKRRRGGGMRKTPQRSTSSSAKVGTLFRDAQWN